MNIKHSSGFRLRSCCLAVGVALAASSPAHAVTFDWGDWSGSWDNTISYGISIRGEDAEARLIGRGNGGTGYIGADDDGNLNWGSGDVFSNIVKGTSEIGIDNGQFGAFGRIKYWYDFELENSKQPHGHVANNYAAGAELNDDEFADYAQFSGLELLDAFVYANFELGDYPLDLRLGRQVVNWGEATFIQGINILNPIDVSAFRRPGAEIKEGLLPVSLIYGNLGLPAGFSLEAFYQFKWEETVIDGCGTYFSDLDFVAKGCNFASVPDAEVAPGVFLPDRILQGVNAVYKDPYVDEPDDDGQFGIALRNYVEMIDTEFGLYYQRLHSRTPVLAVNYTLAGASQSVLGTNPVPVYYQVQYPEDIDIWGLSFATNIGAVAVSGEVSFKQDLPVSVNSTTILAGGLGSLSTLDPRIPPEQKPCLVNPLLLGQFGPRACEAILQFAANPLQNSGIALGWDRFDVTQAQATALYFWDQGLGSERVTLIGEVAWIGVDDLSALAVMPYGRNSLFGAPQTGLRGPSDDGFVTSNSWGYRIRAAATYPNVFAGVELTPSIAWSHDVDGTSPTPTFIDGRKAFSVALGANYLTKYRASIAYTVFSGGFANTQTDRDFYSFSVAMDF
jgi:hypothetical protein